MIYRALAILILLAPLARANLWTRTNDINGLSAPNPATLTGTAGQVRMTVYAKDSATAKDLSGLASWFEITDQADGYATNLVATITSATNGLVTGFATLNAGTYTAKIYAEPAVGDPLAFALTWDTMVITSAPSAGGVNVSISLTNPVTVTSSGTGNVVTGITASGSVVTEHRGTVAGGSGSALTISGTATSTAVSEIRFGNNLTVTDQGGGTTRVDYLSQTYPAWAVGTNVASYSSVGTQLVTFAEGITNARFDGWSGAGYAAGTSSGKSMGSHGRLLLRGNLWEYHFMMFVPQGGQQVAQLAGTTTTGVIHQTDSAFFGGGIGAVYRSTNNPAASAGGSGGAFVLYAIKDSITNLLMVVPAGAGGVNVSALYTAGRGGNELVGFDGAARVGSVAGYGATASSNGVFITAQNLMLTNTPPSFLRGGNAGLTNNNAINRAAGGGSPGYYSGSAGLALGSSTAAEASGGSGVGYINRTNELYVDGFVETAGDGSSYQPPAQDVRGYVAGWGVADSTIATTELPVTPRRSGQGGGVVSW